MSNFFAPQDTTPISALSREGNLNVGLILPLTGEHAEIGKNMLEASQLALLELDGKKVQLHPIDSTSGHLAVNELTGKINSNKFDLVIGPVLAHQTQAAYPILHARNIPIITFSNDTHLLNHPGLYSIGMMPDQQIERVTQYAAAQQYKHIIALLPNNRYGEVVSQVLTRKKLAADYEILEVIKYPSTGKSAEVDATLATLNQALSKHQTLLEGKKVALLVPEGGHFIKEFSTKFAETFNQQKERIKYLGSSQWDDQQLIKIDALEGAWISSVPNHDISTFENRFYKKFAYKPVKISALAYDAMAIAVVLSKSNHAPLDMLKHNQGFRGISGTFKFKEDGSNERGLAIYEISNRSFKLIDAAH